MIKKITTDLFARVCLGLVGAAILIALAIYLTGCTADATGGDPQVCQPVAGSCDVVSSGYTYPGTLTGCSSTESPAADCIPVGEGNTGPSSLNWCCVPNLPRAWDSIAVAYGPALSVQYIYIPQAPLPCDCPSGTVCVSDSLTEGPNAGGFKCITP